MSGDGIQRRQHPSFEMRQRVSGSAVGQFQDFGIRNWDPFAFVGRFTTDGARERAPEIRRWFTRIPMLDAENAQPHAERPQAWSISRLVDAGVNQGHGPSPVWTRTDRNEPLA